MSECVAHAEDEQAVDGYSKLKVCVVMFMTDLPVERERERKRRGEERREKIAG